MSAVVDVLGLLARGAPSLAARAGEKLMFRTRRRSQSPGEQALLARAEELRVPTAHGDLPAWAWGRGPTVLLVHGWNGRGTQLAAFVEPLVLAGHRVVLFDAPGHGAAPGASSSLVHFADAIESVVDWVRPVFGPLHAVVAHSMGGPATVVAMNRFRRRAPLTLERELAETGVPVRRFVLIAPPIDVADFIRTFSRATSIGERAEELLRERIEQRFGPLEELYAPTLARRLSQPALVIHDLEDKEVPISRGRTLAKAWPGAQLVETRGLGHVRILRDPQIIRRVTDFVGLADVA